MKNKKYLVSLFVLVALLCLGIGYAAVSKNLVIEADATTLKEGVDPSDPNANDPLKENFKVKFDSGTKTVSDATKVTDVVISDEQVTFSVNNLYLKDSIATITLKIVNASEDLAAVIAEPVITNTNNTYFKITENWTEVTLEPGDSQEFTVTVQVIKSAIDHQYADFTITFTANALLR